jgi:predicted phage terminase large subunit-like protein
LIGHLEETGGYELLRLPEQYDAKISCTWPGASIRDPRTLEGELLRPERFGPQQVIEAKSRLGSRGYSAQHQQSPTPAEGALFKRQWFRRFLDIGDAYRLPERQVVVRHDECWTFAVMDPAKSKRKTADYTAIAVLSVTPQRHLIVRHMVRERLGPEEIVPRLNQVCSIYRPRWAGVESDGFQVFIAKETRATTLYAGQYVKKYPYIPEVKELTTSGVKGDRGKGARAQPLIIKFENGEIFLPEEDAFPWVSVLEDELVRFTGHDDSRDDQVDALSWGVIALNSVMPLVNFGELPFVIPNKLEVRNSWSRWNFNARDAAVF